MKINMKKLAAWMLALLLVLQMIPVMAFAGETIEVASNTWEMDEENYRDKLKIMSESSIVEVGSSVQLSVTPNYTLTWESSNEEIALVDENGLVTGVNEGRVKITAIEKGQNGEYRDSVLLKIVGSAESAEVDPEAADNNEENETTPVETKTIVININKKDKVTYDGKMHSIGFVAEGKFDGFDASKVQITNEELLLTGKDCGIYQTKFEDSTENYFTYNGETEGYEFIVSDGWMKIIPAALTIKAEDKVRTFEDPSNIPAPEATTVTMTGLVEGDVINCSVTNQTIDGIIYYIPEVAPDSEAVAANYKITYVSGKVINDAPLYNIVKVGNTYYRLKKTRIRTAKNLKDVLGKTFAAGDYEVAGYDFSDVVIKNGNKTYVYRCAKNAQAIADGADYYTISKTSVSAIQNKIGAMTNNKPNWLIDEADQYPDSNNRDSYHRDFEVKLETNNNAASTQDVYYMLSLNGVDKDYYRLRRGTIVAPPLENYKNAQELKPGEYLLKDYDFTNVILKVGDKEYKYSDHVIEEGEHDAYFTVEFKKVVRQNRINGDETWYRNEDGWLDGAKEQYGAEGNNIDGFHANYNATTYEAVKRERSVTITSDWDSDKLGYVGLNITLTAQLTGYEGLTEGKDYKLEWEYSADNKATWNKVGAEGETFTFTLDEKTTKYSWRVVAVDLD